MKMMMKMKMMISMIMMKMIVDNLICNNQVIKWDNLASTSWLIFNREVFKMKLESYYYFTNWRFFKKLFFKSFLQLRWKFFKTAFTTGFQVKVIKLWFLTKFGVAKEAWKMSDAPSFWKGCKNISINDLITDKTNISKKFVIMKLTIRQALIILTEKKVNISEKKIWN